MGPCALPYYETRTGRVEHGMSCARCQFALKRRYRLEGRKIGIEARDKDAQDGISDQFRWCEQAQLLWRSKGQGNTQPTELPEAARRGGHSNNRE
ncbi:hypothetical protein V8C42DRAFT_329367 [Trichoderma barbatum]